MFVCLFKLGLFAVLISDIFNWEKHVENKLLFNARVRRWFGRC